MGCGEHEMQDVNDSRGAGTLNAFAGDSPMARAIVRMAADMVHFGGRSSGHKGLS